MLEDADLDAAVAEGVLTQDRADALRAFASRRRVLTGADDDEHFRFLRGFTDFFFAIGVVFLGAGILHFASDRVIGNVLGAVLFWALAELLIAKMRLVLPGIFLAVFFVVFAFLALPLDFWHFLPAPGSAGQHSPKALSGVFLGGPISIRAGTLPIASFAIMVKALIGSAAATFFYLRFRFPFALLLIAASLVIAALAVGARYSQDREFFSILFLACGASVFAAAMAFDLSDRERRTRRADCAFWLHLLAAPLIVNSLISLVSVDLAHMTPAAAATILSVVMILTLVAIVIDRRALLVSALIYVGIVVASAIRSAASTDSTTEFFMTLVILGLFVLTLGVGWFPLRRLIVAGLPPALAGRLPPMV
jgi:hypothetical protein